MTTIYGNPFSNTAWYNSQPEGLLYLDNWCICWKGNMSDSQADITIKKGTRGIASYALRNTGLMSITIPESISTIFRETFVGCTNLENIVFEDGASTLLVISETSSSKGFLADSPIKTLYLGRNINFDYDYSNVSPFTSAATLATVTVGDLVTDIIDYAFYGCKYISAVTIGANVKNIGKSAFDTCYGLTEVIIPNGVVNIGAYAFYYCSGIKTLTIGENVETIGRSAFNGCNKLANVIIPNKVTKIEQNAFYSCQLLQSIVIPFSVTEIGMNVFGFCENLTSIAVEEGNTNYNSHERCNAIIETATNTLIRGCKNTTIPYGVTSIGNTAFYGCTELVEVEIPSSVTNIGDNAFYYCNKLSSVTLPQSVTSIGAGAFYSCSALASITCEAKTPPTVGDSYTFYNVPRSTPIYVPESSVSVYKSAEYWSEFTNFVAIPETNISLTDGEDFSQSEAKECDNIFYTRTFNNTNWQALYVPFEIPYENIKDDFEVAYINDTRQYDRDDDGVKEETVIEAFKITSGTLEANYPYLIRAKEAGEKTITVTDAMLYTTEENSIDCSSVYDKYTFTGTYSRMSSTELTGCYALSGGIWQPVAEDASLGAFRFYLQIESRNGNAQAAQSIKMRVIGEETDGDATSIDDVESAGNEQIVYDLAGRRVAKPTKGVYIVNGKKVLYN